MTTSERTATVERARESLRLISADVNAVIIPMEHFELNDALFAACRHVDSARFALERATGLFGVRLA